MRTKTSSEDGSDDQDTIRGFLSPTTSGEDNIRAGQFQQIETVTLFPQTNRDAIVSVSISTPSSESSASFSPDFSAGVSRNNGSTSLSPPPKRQVLPTSPNLANAKQDEDPSSALAFYLHRQGSLEEVNAAVEYDSSQWRDNKTEVVPNALLRIAQLRTNKATLRENNCHPDCHAIRSSNVVQVDVAHFASLSAVDTRLLEFNNGKYSQICWQSQRDVRASILVEAFSFSRANAENFIANHIMNINVIPELMEYDAHSRGDRSTYNVIKERHSESQKTVFESLLDICHNIQTMSVFGTPPHNTMKEWGFFEDAHALSDLLGDSNKGPIGHMTLLACGIISAQQRDRLVKHTIEQYCRVFNLDPADHQLSEEQMDRIIKCTFVQALVSKHIEPVLVELSEQILTSMINKSDEQIEAIKAEIASWLAILSTKEKNKVCASICSIKAFFKNRPEDCTDINISYYKCSHCDNENLAQYNARCGMTNCPSGYLVLRQVLNDDGTMSEDYINPLIPASCTNCGNCGTFNSYCTVCRSFNESLELDEAHLVRDYFTMHCTNPTFGQGSSWISPYFYHTKVVNNRRFLTGTYTTAKSACEAMVENLAKTEDFPLDAEGVHTTDFEPSLRNAFFNSGDPEQGTGSRTVRKLRGLLLDVIPGEGGTQEYLGGNRTRYRNYPWDGVVQYGPYRIQSVGTPLPCLGNRVV